MSSDYEEWRDERFPSLKDLVKDCPLDHSGDWAHLELRLRQTWNAAIEFAITISNSPKKSSVDKHKKFVEGRLRKAKVNEE